jgi:3,4-dihydroxy 2-butanone 4-phosphate synthase/GTP cyclohydrolase II
MAIATTEQAVQDISDGRFVIVVDEEGEESSGDLLLAAEFADTEIINRMMGVARGLLCVALTAERIEELGLTPMSPDGWGGGRAAFAVSVDARRGIQTGDGAQDRAITIQTLIDPQANPGYIVTPGHVFPIRAAEGGVLRRVGHTEAAANMDELLALGDEMGLSVVTIADLIRYRRKTEKLVHREGEADLPTVWGEFRVVIYTSEVDKVDYVAVVKGDPARCDAPLVRVHSGCVTGDILGSLKCDCGWQLHAALERIEAEGCGVVLYIASQEGRGIGLVNKIRAYHLQDKGMDTVEANEALGFPADRRDYGIGAQVLADLGISRMRLMTNNPAKFSAMNAYGLEVVERVPLEAPEGEVYERYLSTKRDRMGHLIREESDDDDSDDDGE